MNCYYAFNGAFCLMLLLSTVYSIEPFTIFGGLAAAVGSAVFYKTFDVIKDKTYCKLHECCNDEYITTNIAKLHSSLKNNVYGQHIVLNTVVPAIAGHVRGNPKKPLTLSFHGTPGSGKNYVAQFIANALYEKGESSKFVHTFNGGMHFPLKSRALEYKATLIKQVKAAVMQCDRSLFIFDEVDKMPEGVLDGLKPLLDYNTRVDGIDYRKSIFIFLSNKGSREITLHLLSLWENGLDRETTKLAHFEQLVIKGAFEEEGYLKQFAGILIAIKTLFTGGFRHSSNIKSGLIDHYIPFFPLERRHVELCAREEFRKFDIYSPTEEQLEEVLSYISYGPENKQIFSKSGCKRISQKVATIVTRDRMQSENDL